MSGLSLWLSPPSSSPFAKYLLELSDRYDTVKFQPHATLVSDALVPAWSIDELVDRIKGGISEWRKQAEGTENGLEIEFMDVRQGDLFYQCVLAALLPHPNLISLHELLLKAFSLPVPSPRTYFPHVSLVYGDLSRDKKKEIIDEMIKKQEVKQGDRSCKVLGEKGFKTEEVLLVRTSGNTDEWAVLARVSLSA